ncbi:L-asparaginase [Cenarchaeum symbiosum A]|uniref:Plant-type L-asparaginase n=1 Tax=Cenarchaeum symbiosum (strain A) TaxID=414004 RepID=A0RU73_CENSY|nr:L-asparaginase [Cenarchaeum symbiosum A]
MDRCAVIVHGGAANQGPGDWFKKGYIRDVAKSAWEKIGKGAAAIEVAEQAVIDLEDSRLFNAGMGSYATKENTLEMDAGIMDGRTLACGGVGAISDVKNPVAVASKVMSLSDHSVIVGPGALSFALSHGMEKYTMELRENMDHEKLGTVGAAILDTHGDMAAAVSTGGTGTMPSGRVGASAIAGSGYYAKNGAGAAATTGNGDTLLMSGTARRCCELMEKKSAAQAASDLSVKELGALPGGMGGIISVDANGEIGFSFNTTSMTYACINDRMDEIWVSL